MLILIKNSLRRRWHFLFWLAGLVLLFAVYASDLQRNPPGFFLDESAHAYNSYLVSRTGAGEFGPRFPLFFQYYSAESIHYADCVPIYLLAAIFRVLSPSILLARLSSALWIFGACLLLGLLAKRISNRRMVGVMVAVTALLTPWFFDVRGVLLGPQFVPMALACFLLTVFHVQSKDTWNWIESAMVAATLALVTYCYTIGWFLGPLLAVGLLFFATSRQRLIGVIKTVAFYAVTLIPLLLFSRSHPGVLTKRLNDFSYIKSGAPWKETASQFIKRYLEDQSLFGLLVNGDYHARHHVPGSGGLLFFATFILVLIGLVIVIARRRRDPWWRFILYGLVIAIVPGAISVEPFHGMRLIAYPVFLLLLTVPALEWLLARSEEKLDSGRSSEEARENSLESPSTRPTVNAEAWPRSVRLGLFGLLLVMTLVEAYRFQTVFRREGPKRAFDFDVAYKAAYEAAIKQPMRPIYLEDGKWGPAYVHAFWLAAVERRPKSQFVRLKPNARATTGKIVISSAENCQRCETILRAGTYHVYKSL